MTSPRTAIYLQDACLSHRYIRNASTSTIVERPERIRAVKIGLAAALARLEEAMRSSLGSSIHLAGDTPKQEDPAGDFTAALEHLRLDPAAPSRRPASTIVDIAHSTAKSDLLNNAAIKFVHGDIGGDVYLEKLISLAKQSKEAIAKGGSEIPDTLSQGDLYLCPGSIDAIQGALGTVCEAVDSIMAGTISRAFVAIRPPGHHCGEDAPSGFCFVNNVAVAAAHAHLAYKAHRAVIFDIDLHHGNGTQAIVWQINEESYRQKLEDDANPAATGEGRLQVFYGSIHDILSYPCEDGKPDIVQAASTRIHGPHGQYIENIHLEPYKSEEHFWDELYANKYSAIFDKAQAFLRATGPATDDVIVFISCGFDACEHEFESMSRHGRKVPASFYRRFAQDATRFADAHARGRLVSVLEGGYSDRALTSGALAHLVGLAAVPAERVRESWWAVPALEKLEKATKRRRGGRKSATAATVVGGGETDSDEWVARALEILAVLEPADASGTSPPARKSVLVPSTRVLRERSPVPVPGPRSSPGKSAGAKARKPAPPDIGEGDNAPKRVPRVVLKVGPKPG